LSEISIEILNTNIEEKELLQYLEICPTVTIFHRPRFLSYHNTSKFEKLKGFTFQHFIFRRKGRIIAFIPGAFFESDDGIKTFQTPFYSSYGGITYNHEITLKSAEDIVDGFIDSLKSIGTSKIIMSTTPSVYLGELSSKINYFHYLLKVKGFEILNCDMILSSNITDENIMNTLSTDKRRQVKDSYKYNLNFQLENFSEEIYDLLLENRKRLNTTPTHTLDELLKLKELFPDKVFAFTARKDQDLLAGAIGFSVNRNVFNIFYAFDSTSSRQFKGMQFVYYNVMNWAKENGFQYVDLGSSTFGLVPHYPLISFKEEFNANPFLRTIYGKNIFIR